MNENSRHISVHIDRPATKVYEYALNPVNLPEWAAGVGSGAAVTFAPRNEFGVLDHEVTLPSGQRVHNPMRVIADGPDGCEVVFTLRRAPGMGDVEFDRDAQAVAADLATLKRNLEAR